MNILFLQRYNNYANRIIKTKELYIEDFMETQASAGNETFLLENVNFNPNDGITTSLIVGDTTTKQFPGWIPDYCIVYDPEDIIYVEGLDKNFTPFKSSWFIIEAKRTRGNQYNLFLKRDVIRDNYDTIKEADIYVEKGTVDENDSFIFNSEGLNLNQIKKEEILLKDKTEMQWLVGYCVQDENSYSDLSATYSVPPSGSVINWSSIPTRIKNFINLEGEKETEFLADYDNSADFEIYYKIVNKLWTTFVPVDNYASVYTRQNAGWNAIGTGVDNSGYGYALRFTHEKQMAYDINSWDGWDGVSAASSAISRERTYIMAQYRNEQGLSNYEDYITLLNQYNGRTIYNGTTGKYYTVFVEYVNGEPVETIYKFNTSSNVRSRVRQCFYEGDSNYRGTSDGVSWNDSTSSNENYFKLKANKIKINVRINEQGSNTIHWTINSRRKHVIKEPYDMFCIPYGDFQCAVANITCNKEASIAACRAAALSGIGQNNAIIYDVQVLPYCPIPNIVRGKYINENLLTEHENYEYIYGPNNVKMSIAFWCTESEFTFDIPCRIDVSDVKLESECDMYRLCSPNYAGVFEFNVAKNKGLRFINVDCSYKPFQPYIHLNPDFNGLYGQDFNDSRGLICGGDFSLSIATNAWEQYKLQNKNYQAIFDREIQKMDNDFALDISTNSVKRVNNTVMETAQGAMSGGMVGAIFGAVHGVLNTAADTVNDAVGYNLERDYKKDMFTLQNGNVKALPNSLAKTDPFTYNNKKWPFLEKYTCTDEEKEALRLKLRYNGMNIGRIGKITEYINPSEQRFFQGQLIRDNYIIEDSHMVDAIFSELAKGVYL